MMKCNYFTGFFLSQFCNPKCVTAALVLVVCLLGTSVARADTVFTAALNGNQVVPATNSTATGIGSVILNDSENEVIVTINLNGLQNTPFTVKVHSPAQRGATAGMIFTFPNGVSTDSFNISTTQVEDLKAGLWYFSVTTSNFPNGVIRGQVEPLCAAPPANIASWYRAENNANDSEGGNSGIAPNGVSYPSGKVGQAFGFNGTNQYANLGKFFDYGIFTISMWVKPGETQLASATIADNNRSGTSNWSIEQKQTATNNYQYSDKGGSVSFNLDPNVWQHLTVVRTQNLIAIYRDGVLLSSLQTTAQVSYDSAQTLMLARYFNRFNQGSNRYWNGQIDEFTVFSRALSEKEIQNLYNSVGLCPDSGATRGATRNGKIAFQRRDGSINDQVFTIDPDGSAMTNVTNNLEIFDFHPGFSPDGSKIVFARQRQIFTMNPDGSSPKDLINPSTNMESYPRWSPDGSKISFVMGGSEATEIYTISPNGTNLKRLTNNSFYDYGANWSPDGRKLAFTSTRNGGYSIFTMNADGSNQTRITFGTQDFNPSWSPDGTKIVFTRNGDIHTMNPDGSGVVKLTNTPANSEYDPVYSPDGTKIVFTRYRSDAYDLFIMNPDGSGQTSLVNNAFNGVATWQPLPVNENNSAFPAGNIRVTFSNLLQPGRVAAVPLLPKQMPPLLSNYVPASLVYDIRTSASYSSFVTVSFTLTQVESASACSEYRVLHFTDSDWSDVNNEVPVFDSGSCTISQKVSTLSPFTVARTNFSPTTASISGAIIYGTTPSGQADKFVSKVSLTANGSSFDVIETSPNGSYLFEDLVSNGRYSIRLSKTGSVNGITPFDATLVLRFVAAGANGALTPNQRLAADTDSNGSVTAFDATQILRYVAANATNETTGAIGTWKFNPPVRNYNSVFDSMTDENYDAILVGDVDGSWEPPQTSSSADAAEETIAVSQVKNSSFVVSADVEMGRVEKYNHNSETTQPDGIPTGEGSALSLATNAARIENGTLVIPILLANDSKPISGYALDVTFDSNILELDTANPFDRNKTLTANGFLVVSDTSTPGRIGIAASSGANMITTGGTLLKLRFKMVNKAKIASGKTTLTLSRTLLESN